MIGYLCDEQKLKEIERDNKELNAKTDTNANLYNKRQCPRQQNNQQQQLFLGREFFRDKFLNRIFLVKSYLPKSFLAG